jgi:hypothetical protein
VAREWLYYNARAPLTAIWTTKTPYLLYQTGDVFLPQPCSWIDQALGLMETVPQVKVANLVWNRQFDEARREAVSSLRSFYLSKQGFSDQMFLVPTPLFRQPIYYLQNPSETTQFPRGEVFEKRVYLFMKKASWWRITYQRGSYCHPH